MNKLSTFRVIPVLLVGVLWFTGLSLLSAQTEPDMTWDSDDAGKSQSAENGAKDSGRSSRLDEPKPRKFFSHGPRIGATLIYNGVDMTFGVPANDLAGTPDIGAVISQFGYHMDFDIITKANIDPVFQMDILFGGVEQGVIIPSLSALIGLRINQGLEFGFGPNISVGATDEGPLTPIPSWVIVVGYNFLLPEDNIAFPVDFAFVFTDNYYRFTLLTGFNFP